MSFKKFLLESGILEGAFLNEVFESDSLKRIIDAAKVSAKLETSDYTSKQKELDDRGWDVDFSKNSSSKSEYKTYKARGFSVLNQILYAETGYAELDKLPEDAFIQVTAKEGAKWKDDNYLKFYLGADKETGAEQLVGIIRGSNKVMYSVVSKYGFNPYGDARLKKGYHMTDRDNRLDRLPKSVTNKYTPFNRGSSWRGNWGRTSTQHDDPIPTQKKFIEMSDTCIIMDMNVVKVATDSEGIKKHKEREDLRKGRYIPNKYKLSNRATSFTQKMSFENSISDEDIKDANLKRYTELRKKTLLPSDVKRRYIEVMDKVNAARKNNLDNSESIRKLRTMEAEINKLVETFLYNLQYYMDSSIGDGRYVDSRSPFDKDGRVSWKGPWRGEERLKEIMDSIDKIEQKLGEFQ